MYLSLSRERIILFKQVLKKLQMAPSSGIYIYNLFKLFWCLHAQNYR